MAEYLGATIDIDITEFQRKMDKMVSSLEDLDRIGNKHTSEFAQQFKDAIKNADLKPLQQTIGQMEGAMERLGKATHKNTTLTKESFDSVLAAARKSTDSLKRMVEQSVEAERVAINGFLPDNRSIPKTNTTQAAMSIATEQDWLYKQGQATEDLASSVDALSDARERAAETAKSQTKADEEYADGAYSIDESIKHLKETMDSVKFDFFEGGTSSMDEAKQGLFDIRNEIQLLSANPDITKEQRDSLKQMSAEAKVTTDELKKLETERRKAEKEMSKAGNILGDLKGMDDASATASKSDEGNGGFSLKSLSKSLMEAKRLASGSATSITGAVQTISRSLKASGIGMAIGAIVLYIKSFYEWNKKLLQQNWAGFKDKIDVLRGIKTESQALEASAKRRAKALDEETEALMENIRAEKERKTLREKADVVSDRGQIVRDTLNGVAKRDDFNFLPEFMQKMIGTYKNYTSDDLLNMIVGDENRKSVANFLDMVNDPKRIETMTSEEVELAKRDAMWAIERSNALAKVEEAQKSINTLEEQYAKLHKEAEAEIAKGVRAFDASVDDYEDYNATSQERASATLAVLNNQKKSLEGLKKEYQSILDYQQGILGTEKEIESVMNKETFQRNASDARGRIDSRSVTSLGGSEWASDQSTIDDASRSLSKFNDLRAFELNLIKRREELTKSGIDASDIEFSNVEKLKVELGSLSKQIDYLKNNGVDSKTNSEMVEDLQKSATIKRLELKKALYEMESTVLAREAELRKSSNDIMGGSDREVENNKVMLELASKRLDLLRRQKEITQNDYLLMAEQVGQMRSLVNEQRNLNHEMRMRENSHEASLGEEALNARQFSVTAGYNRAMRYTTDPKKRLEIERSYNVEIQRIEVDRQRLKIQTLQKQKESLVTLINECTATEEILKAEERIAEFHKMEADEVSPARKALYEQDLAFVNEQCATAYETREQYELVNAELETANAELDSIASKDPNDIAPNEQAIKRMQKAADILGSIGDGFSNIADTMENNLGGNGASNVVSGLGSLFGGIASAMDMKSKGESGELTASDKIGAWMQAAEFVADQTTKIVSTQRAIEQSAERWRQTVEQVAHEYAMIELSKMEYEQKNIFGVEDPYKKLEDNAKKYAKARELTYDAISKVESQGIVKVGEETKEKWDQIAKDTLVGAGVGAAAGSTAMGVGAAVGAVAGAVTGFVTGLFAEKEVVDVFDTLQNKFGEVFDPDTLEINDNILASYDQLDDKTKKLVDNYKELKEEMEEAKEAYMDYAKTLFGDLGGSLSESLVDAFRNDELYTATNDFRDYVKKQMENIISQQVYSKVFGQIFDGINASVANSLERGDASDLVGIMSSLPYETEQLVSTYGVLMQQIRDAMGNWDLFDPEETAQEALQGSISSMTEDTAGKLNGNFMGLKLSAMEINESVGEMREIMAGNSSLLSRSLNFLEAIADNTSYCRRLESIENTMNQIQISGLKVI